MTAVGLFVDAGQDRIDEVTAQVPLGLLQFHGHESSSFCRQQQLPWIKALRMRPGTDIATEASPYAGAAGLLLDSFHDSLPGGTGQTFDWADVPAGMKKPIILAGGLTPENVASAVLAIRPYAVDVSSGVETGKGIKDPSSVARFIAAVRTADNRPDAEPARN